MDNKPAYDRYQFKPLRGSSHYWALDHLKLLPADAKVLDVGPGSGAIGQHLREQGVKRLVSIEVDAPTREKLSEVYDQIEPDISAFALEHFDAILLLDVLEHMADPEAFLLECRRLLNPGGVILVSVPNVAHWTVRLSLLFGFFEYTRRGILDRTHLHFFTRSSLVRMLRRCQPLVIEEVKESITPLELLLPGCISGSSAFSALTAVRIFAARLLPGLFAYQNLAFLKYRKVINERT